MGKIVKAMLIAIVMLQFVSCGKTEKHEHKSYPTVKVVSKGAFLYCKWYGQLEVCTFERQICRRNWAFPKPVFKCFIRVKEVIEPEPILPTPTAMATSE